MLKSVGWWMAGESGLARAEVGRCFDMACSRSFTEVVPAVVALPWCASVRSSVRRTCGGRVVG